MRYAAGHREQTRERILRAAGKVFRRQGYHASGVDKVMEEAGLTPGGFYSHFASKEALLAEMLGPVATEAGAVLGKGLDSVPGPKRVDAFIDRYLSTSHRTSADEGCPLPALVSEVARSSAPVKASFETIIRSLAEQLTANAGEKLTEDRALAVIALCVGGLSLARSVNDPSLGERILAACRELAKVGVAGNTETQAAVSSSRRHKGKN